MKKLIILFLHFSFVIATYSQDISFDIQSTGDLKDKWKIRTMDTQVIGKDNNFTYFLCLPYSSLFNETSIGVTSNFFIAKCDTTPKLIQKTAIDLKYKEKDRLLEGVLLLNDKLTLFTSFQNLKQKKHYLFVQRVSKDNLQAEDSLKLIGEIDYSGYSKYFGTTFHYTVSADRSKILVYYNLVSDKRENLKYGMYVYNSDMKLIWKNDDVVPQMSEGVFSYQKYTVDNDGNVYILGKTYKNIGDYNSGVDYKSKLFSSDTHYSYLSNYKFQLYKYSSTATEHATITIPNTFINNLTFLPNTKNSVFCAGIYSSPGMISAKGCFTLNLDIKTSIVSNLETKEFSGDLLKNVLNENELDNFRDAIKNKEEWDPYEYRLSEIKTHENGEKYFIAEQFILGKKKETSGRITYIYPTYTYNDLLIIGLKKNNKIKQVDKLVKNQYNILDDKHGSYCVFEKNNSLYFIFMEILRKSTFLKNAEPGNTFLVRLDPSGEQKKLVFKNTAKESKLFFLPRSAISLGQGKLIYSLITNLGRNYAYEKLKIN